jgi:septum formation protein
MPIVLASASPRRVELLRAADIACDVHPADVDESRNGDEAAADYVRRVAGLKADAAVVALPGRDILAADTAVVVDGEVFGKPADADDAARMLRRLSGRAHQVLTGVVIVRGDARRLAFVETTGVWFRPLRDADIRWYVASGEPMGKAGAYAIQGLASRFIPRIDGSYSNVVGLPVARVVDAMDELGVDATGTGRP